MAASKRRQDEKHLKLLREFGALQYNKQCFDCHQRGPTYVNMTIGSFVCTSCSGILRGLNPPHRVKSISMASFTVDEIEFIRNKGNEFCRREWMGTYDGQPPIESETKDEQRIKDFMITKYERKRWYTDPSTFRHQPMPTSQLTSHQPPVAVNNKQNTMTNNITINRPVMQSASFPPPSSSGRPSMDLLGSSGSNANASFANFDNFVSVSTNASANLPVLLNLTNSSLEAVTTDDNVPIVEKKFNNRAVGPKRSLGLSFFPLFSSKGTSRFPVIDSKHHSKPKTGVDVESIVQSSSFLGPSNPSSVGAHPASTNTNTDSAFEGIISTGSNTSSSTTVLPKLASVTSQPISKLQHPPTPAEMKDRYAALADLDSLFNSSAPSGNGGGGSTTAPVEWDAGKSNNSNAWNSAFPVGGYQLQQSSSMKKEFDNVQTPSNPFTGASFNSSTWNQKPNLASVPSPGNPFASSILNQANNASSFSSEPFGMFSDPNAVRNNYPTGPTHMGWENMPVGVPTPFLAATTNGNYTGYKSPVQPQFGLWQPSVGNPFAAPQKSNSSNPFL